MKYGYSKVGNGFQRTNDAWRNIDVAAIKDNPEMGYYYHFNAFRDGWSDLAAAGGNGKVTLVQATAGQIVINDAVPGEVQVDSNSTTDNQGATAFFPGTVVIPNPGTVIVLKTVLRARDLANGIQSFIGLVLSTLDTVPVTADVAAAGATDYVGLIATGNTGTAGRVFLAAEDGGTQSLDTNHVHTFLDGDVVTDGSEVVKFEIRINGDDSIELYVDGVKTQHTVAASAIPEGTALRLAISALSAGTTDPILGVLDVELASVSLN